MLFSNPAQMFRWWLALATLLPMLATAQTLVFTNGIQTFSALTNATVTMTGRCELRLSATNNAISGCTINLNSTEAWVIFLAQRPSLAAANYLGQIKINGVAAVSGSNCRVVEYLNGSVIIPQSSSFTPLQLFSAPNFLGTSTNLALYTYYTNNALGVLNKNVSSFKLKRGYSATFAQNTDGTGSSKVFIAQDSDLEIGILATNLDHQCSFVRVFPWRWIGKKGWGGAADGTAALVNPLWNYDWNNGATSTADTEYVPIRWGGGETWDPYSTDNSKQNSTHILGFNEPDSTAQANLTVATAIADWPNLMQSGLRVGAPAVSDSGVAGQGLDWLYSFMNQATNLNYRVDYIPIHFYKCGWSASQLYNYLLGVYQQTGKPIWLTEFNYGASWCTPDTVTQAQEAANIQSFIDTLDSAPFVERYAIYQWFPTNRAMVVNGALTPAGAVYASKVSSLAYAQTLPLGGTRGLAQFQFETNTLDSSSYGNNGFAVGAPNYVSGHTGQALALDGTNSFVQLPPNFTGSNAFTFAAWIYWNGGANWQRIFDFGTGTPQYFFLTPSSGSSTLRFAITTNTYSSEQIIETSPLPANQWRHVAITISGSNAKLYTNGTLAAASSTFTLSPATVKPTLNYLGKSQFATDPLFNGRLDEVLIADYAFTAAQIASLQTNQPPQFTTNFLVRSAATFSLAYSNNLISTATDPNTNDVLSYSKSAGPNWLNISTNGILTGTPAATDVGTNNFTIRVTDTAGASSFALLTINTVFTNGSGIWTVDANGNWSDASNWNGNLIANGTSYSADFSTLNITADHTVTLDASRSIGSLKFSDTSGTSKWFLVPSNNATLTLDSGSATSPLLTITNTTTISANLGGTNGLTKTGTGTLILSGGNSLSGTLNIDTAQPSAGNDGIVRLANPLAAANLSTINIRNQNAASSSLQLDGSNGNLNLNAPITLNGRTASVPAIENLSGTNILGGNLTINTGGGNYWIQSDSGLLTFTGSIFSTATGSRTFTFQGNGETAIAGVISNGSASIINLSKIGSGGLTLNGSNTFSGTLSVSAGRVCINGSINSLSLYAGNLGGNGLINNSVNLPTGSTLMPGPSLTPGNSIGTLTINNTLTLQPGSFTLMEIDKTAATNDQIVVGNTLNYNGTLTISNLTAPLVGGGTFQLFNTPNFTGNFSNVLVIPSTGLDWNFNPTNGVLSIFSTIPPNLNSVLTNNSLLLSWPADHLGWTLQMQTNDLNTGLNTNWVRLPATTQTNTYFAPITTENSSTFFRLIYP